jgi:hypothetical protein
MHEPIENHEGVHGRWKYVSGLYRGEDCSHYLRGYIVECRQCRIQGCDLCRRNGLFDTCVIIERFARVGFSGLFCFRGSVHEAASARTWQTHNSVKALYYNGEQ